jgi:basic membrane protein A
VAGLIFVGSNLFSSCTGPSTRPSVSPSTSAAPGSESPGPTAVNRVGSIVLVAAVGESAPATPSGLTWAGVQQAASRLGAASSRVVPQTMAELTAAPNTAAAGGATVVVTVGPEAAPATLAAALAQPQAQFFMIDQTAPDGAPPNLHGLVFDEAEAGYLAGFVAASVSGKASVGMVGDSASDTRSRNYWAGFRSGAVYAEPSVKVTVAYATGPLWPDRGRTAAATLVKGGADVVLALPDLSGIGAMREACARKALIVAADVDAWQLVPDVQSCLVTSVRKRFDVAIATAVGRYSAGAPVAPTTVFDVASGGLDLTEFHADVPPALPAQLAGVIAAMQSGPPRLTPTPAATPIPTVTPIPTPAATAVPST